MISSNLLLSNKNQTAVNVLSIPSKASFDYFSLIFNPSPVTTYMTLAQYIRT